jgi:hypothetical protein
MTETMERWRHEGNPHSGTDPFKKRQRVFHENIAAQRPGSGRPGQSCPIANREVIPALPGAGWLALCFIAPPGQASGHPVDYPEIKRGQEDHEESELHG